VVAAAKQEGRLVLLGPVGSDVRDGLIAGFQRKYPEIAVEYLSSSGPQAAPKLITETSAGQHLTDVVVQGTTTMVGSLIPASAIEPVWPYLVGPSSAEQAQWRGGKFDFSDESEQYNLVFVSRVQIPMVINPTVVPAGAFTSWKDLLDPRWKGRLVMDDPRQAGPGLDNATFWYTREDLGTTFMQQLFAQEPVVSADDRQVLDFVARGQYPVLIGGNVGVTLEMKSKGLPLELYSGEALREGSFVSSGSGTVAIASKPPHPNAAKVYLDYLLSREGQTEYSRFVGVPSRRQDVPTDHLAEFLVPKPGVQYQENYKERYVNLRQAVTAAIAPLIRS
jgi:iron(III) transport system substrate-binding protein